MSDPHSSPLQAQPSSWSARRWLLLAGSLALGVFLIVMLIRTSTLTATDILSTAGEVKIGYVALMLVSTLIHFSLSAWKWRLSVAAMSPHLEKSLKLRFFVLYTAIGAALGQIMPLQVSTTLSRSLGLKIQRDASVIVGASTSIYEQLFDILIPALFVIPSLLVFGLRLSLSAWLFASAIVMLASLVLIPSSASLIVPRLAALVQRIPLKWALWVRLQQTLTAAVGSPLIAPRTTLTFMLISLMRYANLMVRAVLVIFATGLLILPKSILLAMPLVQLSVVVSMTPGNIGTTEWTWSGLLAMEGYDFGLIAQYSLFFRLLGVLTELLATAFVVGTVAVQGIIPLQKRYS